MPGRMNCTASTYRRGGGDDHRGTSRPAVHVRSVCGLAMGNAVILKPRLLEARRLRRGLLLAEVFEAAEPAQERLPYAAGADEPE